MGATAVFIGLVCGYVQAGTRAMMGFQQDGAAVMAGVGSLLPDEIVDPAAEGEAILDVFGNSCSLGLSLGCCALRTRFPRMPVR